MKTQMKSAQLTHPTKNQKGTKRWNLNKKTQNVTFNTPKPISERLIVNVGSAEQTKLFKKTIF